MYHKYIESYSTYYYAYFNNYFATMKLIFFTQKIDDSNSNYQNIATSSILILKKYLNFPSHLQEINKGIFFILLDIYVQNFRNFLL